MKTIQTSTVIDAPPEVVWQVITDMPAYRDWNPFITSLGGDLHVGGQLRATFSLPGRKPRTFTPTVIALEPGRQLIWLGRLALPKLFDGEHKLAIEPADGRTLFIHSERFRGVLPPLMGGLLAATHDAFRAMDHALARHAETVAAGA